MSLDENVSARIMALLSEWGWDAGLEKLKREIATAATDDERAALRFFTGWLAGERGHHAEALHQFGELENVPAFRGRACAGRAYVALRQKDYRLAHSLLDRAHDLGKPDDLTLQATISQCRGAVYSHEGRADEALAESKRALELFGNDHLGAERALDTLGMVYGGQHHFHAARSFYEQSLTVKEKFRDHIGVALSHGQLGRLYLDWGNFDKAQEHFRQDLEICQRIGDDWGEAQMHSELGRVALARKEWSVAGDSLDEGIRRGIAGALSQPDANAGWLRLEAFARKDRAIAHVMQGETAEAEKQIEQASKHFDAIGFAEGAAHVNRALGILRRAQGRHAESEKALRNAMTHFDSRGERAEVARTRFESALTLRASGAARSLVARELVAALDLAERCRRDALVREIEDELKRVDETEHCRRAYRRARGRNVREDTTSLLSGERETASVLFLDIQGSTEFARTRDPEVVMMTLNEMMAELTTALELHGASVTVYLGDGFMALARGSDHATRAVRAALGLMEKLRDFNVPREILGLRSLKARVGVATGEVFIGNVGTYQKMDFTAIGTTVNLAARLQTEAEPGLPCVSRATFEQVQDIVVFREGSPRTVTPKGIGEQQVWDVLRLKDR